MLNYYIICYYYYIALGGLPARGLVECPLAPGASAQWGDT